MVSAKKTKGFTLIELLVVVAIIALLVGIMVPAVQNALDKARDTVVRTELKSIELGLNLFKSDFGDYPSSSEDTTTPGAQLLSDVIAGEHLRGYEDPVTGEVLKDPYIEVGDMEFEPFDPFGGHASYLMKCKWGEPILYYSAAAGARPTWEIVEIYDGDDNDIIFSTLYDSGRHSSDALADNANYDVIDPPGGDYDYSDAGPGLGHGNFYNFIVNPDIPIDTVTESPCPYKVDSFILISAGKDGEYGTDDDVTNFK